MKELIRNLIGNSGEKQPQVNLDVWFKALGGLSRHLSQISAVMKFESFARHATDAICQGLSPLQPVAAHFHIDVSVSHLWLPDPTFRLDVFYRLQNRVLMPSQTRPVETSRDELFTTHVIVPFEMHKHAVEVMLYHKEDPSGPVQNTVQSILNAFSISLTQNLQLREEHILLREEWGKRAEKMLGNRLSGAIYQVQSPFLFAQTLRGFHLPSGTDSSEHLFLNHNNSTDIYKFIVFKLKNNEPTADQRIIAFISAMAAQLRYFEHTSGLTSFHDFVQFFSQSIDSLSHLLTLEDEISFVVGEFAHKSAVLRWHSSGLPPPFIFGQAAESFSLPHQPAQKGFQLSSAHDWTSVQQVTLPPDTGILFYSENVLKRLDELNIVHTHFFERLRPCTHAANVVIEAEKTLSKPDVSKVVAASVTDWDSLPFDISMLAAFNLAQSPKSFSI
jgi:hypothetical protein